jgi:hypothetical protein
MLIVRDFNGIMHLLQGKEKALFQDHLSGLDVATIVSKTTRR